MRNTRMMIRFLDLTLLLLMAFLLQADLTRELPVPLPHGSAESGGEDSDILRIHLLSQSWQVLDQRTRVCAGRGEEQLRACLIRNAGSGTTIFVTPMQSLRVQRLVDVLDICAELGMSCATAADP